ncbi:hypothetical protein NKG05_08435 [Oerskovia sp. M15]
MTHEPQDLRNIRVTRGIGFTVALFVRDRLALPVAEYIPALVPRVAVEALPSDEAEALADEWLRWWDLLAGAPTGRVVSPRSERLASACDALVDEASAWAEETVRPNLFLSEADLDPTVAAAGLVAGTPGDPGVPLVYDIELVPVSGRWCQDLGPTRLLVSVETWEDRAGMDAVLEPRIRRIQAQVTAAPAWFPSHGAWSSTGRSSPSAPASRTGHLRLPLGERADRGLWVHDGPLRGGTLPEDVLRREIRGFVEGYEP